MLESNVSIVFIGECKQLENRIQKTPYANKFYFLGEVRNFKEIMKIGNLFLNPPRQGGGTGAIYAIENEVPVLTLANCDVAQVGQEFVCNSMEEMPYVVQRYVHDPLFMKSKQEVCRKKAKELCSIDNVNNVRIFCEKLECYIKSKEKMALDRR